eukprot:12730-Heterococcus_DN1.PRE.2
MNGALRSAAADREAASTLKHRLLQRIEKTLGQRSPSAQRFSDRLKPCYSSLLQCCCLVSHRGVHKTQALRRTIAERLRHSVHYAADECDMH